MLINLRISKQVYLIDVNKPPVDHSWTTSKGHLFQGFAELVDRVEILRSNHCFVGQTECPGPRQVGETNLVANFFVLVMWPRNIVMPKLPTLKPCPQKPTTGLNCTLASHISFPVNGSFATSKDHEFQSLSGPNLASRLKRCSNCHSINNSNIRHYGQNIKEQGNSQTVASHIWRLERLHPPNQLQHGGSHLL